MYYTLKKIFSCLALLGGLLIFFGCRHKNEALENALQKAKGNRLELEKVLAHYSQNPEDSLQLKAAEILISNMDDLYYYDGEEIDKYVPALYEIHKHSAREKQVMDSMKALYGEFSWDLVKIKYDLEELSSKFLIGNIDMAFKVWRERPWGKKINFDQFCEYLLPYRVSTEKPQYNRREVYEKYNWLLDSVEGDGARACARVNEFLTSRHFVLFYQHNFFPPLSYTVLEKAQAGSCLQAAIYTTLIMRALGIPVTLDYTPQWANRGTRHYWNALILPDKKLQAFMGTQKTDIIPIHPMPDVSKKGKVYRKMLKRQTDNMELLTSASNFPAQFESGRLLDVTHLYSDCADVTIPLILNQTHSHTYAYTFVFNNRDWVANSWGRRGNNKVTFRQLEKGILCLPAFFTNEQQISPINYPFYLTPLGDPHFLVPENKRSLMLTRKHPVIDVKFRLQRMIGSKFQGANKSDFSDAVDLYEIKGLPSILFQETEIACNKSFRYLRYLSPPNEFCNIAELEFYGGKSNVALRGKIIGTSGTRDRTKECARDGKPETFFESHEATGAWVGIDLGKGNAQRVKSICFLPANDDNNIRPGDGYELFYWGKEGWISVGKQVATDYLLFFDNAPQNALFLLHNHSRGREERIFTYENGEQVWW